VVPSLLLVFSLFGVLTPTGEKIVISIIFHLFLVCNNQELYVWWSWYGQENFLSVALKLLWRFELIYLSIYVCLIIMLISLCIIMICYPWLCLVDSYCWCNLVLNHIVSLSCHLILLVLLGTPRFGKLYN
jgi:hypothetical protein